MSVPKVEPYSIDGRDGDGHDDESARSRLWFGLIAIIVALSFFPWVWRWSPWADRTADGLLDDKTFALQAEPLCIAAMAELEALPNAIQATDTAERGDQIRAANNILHSMVDDLEAMITGSPRDIENLNEWIGNWRTYMDNRDDYADRISVDESAVFYVDAVGTERLDRRIPRFANSNFMLTCSPPDDIA